MARTHRLKIWPQYFAPLFRGEKTFEVRKNDREFMIGDFLVLAEYDPELKKFTGRECKREVIYMAENLTAFGIPEDVVVLAIK